MKRLWYIPTLLAALLSTLTLTAEPPQGDPGDRPPPPPRHDRDRHGDRPPPPPRHGGRRHPGERDSERRFRFGPGVWQAFSQLTPEERVKMQKLQREDPEKFHELMRAKADELFAKRRQRREALRQLAEKCRSAATAEEREQLKRQLTAEVEKDFRDHLAANRRQLEEMKRRTALLEAELQRREQNCARAVAARVDAMIRGENPPHPSESRRFDRKPLEK